MALLRGTACAAVLVVVMAGCGTTAGGGGSADRPTLTVLAAASLTDAMSDLAATYEVEEQVEVDVTFGPSSGLREQVLAGVPADVFASANAANMDMLVDAGEVSGPRVFTRNRLQIAVAPGNPLGITELDDLARDDLLVGLCAPEVPCGATARRVLADAGVDAAPDTEATDVRALVTLVAGGDLDVALVYVTDVLAAGGEVAGIDLAGGLDAGTEYLIAPLDRAGDQGLAGAFVDFVLSSRGQSVLRGHGFRP